MEKKRAIISSIYILLIVLGLIFTAVYFNSYISNTRHAVYFVFALLSVAESLFVGLSFCFYLRGLKNRFVTITHVITHVISIFLTIPILFFALVWILSFIGIQIVPPAQH